VPSLSSHRIARWIKSKVQRNVRKTFIPPKPTKQFTTVQQTSKQKDHMPIPSLLLASSRAHNVKAAGTAPNELSPWPSGRSSGFQVPLSMGHNL
jgi:hypothetical protein